MSMTPEHHTQSSRKTKREVCLFILSEQSLIKTVFIADRKTKVIPNEPAAHVWCSLSLHPAEFRLALMM